jgi:phospholipase/carboxylesterase
MLISRRAVLRQLGVGAAAMAAGACNLDTTNSSSRGSGRIRTRPSAPTQSIVSGQHAIGFGQSRDGLVYVPASYRPQIAAPLALLFHGAGQRANELLDAMRSFADDTGLILLAPDSRAATWDVINGSFGADIVFIEAALAVVFSRINVDPARITVAGFSDGATYALSVGLINGDFFTKVAAFSPGYIVTPTTTGKPKLFITHGTRDSVLPIAQASRVIVPRLLTAGYSVQYHEFDGGHNITPELLRSATTWLSTA